MNRQCEFSVNFWEERGIMFILVYRMLDDFGNELDSTESKLDSTMKKVAKVLRMNNGEFLDDFFVGSL